MADPTTPLDLTGLRKLTEAATPGPWTAHSDGLVWPERMGDPVSGSVQLDDAEFIAAARTAVPALLAALAEAQRREELMRPVVEAARRWRHRDPFDDDTDDLLHLTLASYEKERADG